MSIDLQRVSIKIHSEAPSSISLDPFLEIFGRWRTEKANAAEWIDLADYAHVPKGPGVLLIGLKAMFSFDLSDPAPGLQYVTRRGLAGPVDERIKTALRSALDLSHRMISEKNYPSAAKLRTDSLELSFPDRLVSPSTASTDALLRPAIDATLNAIFGAGSYQITPGNDHGASYGFSIKAAKGEALDALRARLG